MKHRLFVYGTLAPGRPNAHVLADVPGIWEPATVRGTLFAQGWGAAIGFPGIVLDDSGDEVQGLVFSSEQLPDHWARLDEFEGDGYARVLTRARLQDGSVVDAFVYTLSDRSLPDQN
ncbi:MAG TPA: gamma-glutamylcyclotransferase family protein [Lysobacter sp.]